MSRQPPKRGLARKVWDLTDEEVAEIFDDDEHNDDDEEGA